MKTSKHKNLRNSAFARMNANRKMLFPFMALVLFTLLFSVSTAFGQKELIKESVHITVCVTIFNENTEANPANEVSDDVSENEKSIIFQREIKITLPLNYEEHLHKIESFSKLGNNCH